MERSLRFVWNYRATVTLLAGLFVGGFAGVEYSRNQVRNLAEAVADAQETGITNSFGVCLTKLWEESGELDPEWKGKRGWSLVTRPDGVTE